MSGCNGVEPAILKLDLSNLEDYYPSSSERTGSSKIYYQSGNRRFVGLYPRFKDRNLLKRLEERQVKRRKLCRWAP